MTLPKWLLYFVIFLFLNTPSLQAITLTDLEKNMKDFKHQIHLYFQCAHDSKCLKTKKIYLRRAFFIGLIISEILYTKKYLWTKNTTTPTGGIIGMGFGGLGIWLLMKDFWPKLKALYW